MKRLSFSPSTEPDANTPAFTVARLGVKFCRTPLMGHVLLRRLSYIAAVLCWAQYHASISSGLWVAANEGHSWN